MNLKALQLFSSIMSLGTLTRAAEAHFLSESAASRQLSVLETELGFKLFSREKRSLIPTPQGRKFYLEAERILYGLNDLPDIAQAIKREQKSSLRLISIPRLVRQIVSPAVARFCHEDPELQVKVDVQAMRYLQRWVAGFQFHIGLGRLPAEHPAIVTRKFCSLPTMVVLPRGHRLANRSELTLDDLEGESVVSLLKDTHLRKNIDSIYQAEGKTLRASVEVSSSYNAGCIVASGFGITIGDPFVAHSLGDGELVHVPLKTDFRYDFAFFEPAQGELSDTTKLFMKHVEEVAQEYMKRNGF
ncbi:LysR family transcriptional regulator [Endozoicomonas arenosclerae]|uniref:LysR family transcriptional regulator n=1 Tax=Endozoicomonas arenosclerae TaxID=1633495 RepID=UPI000780C2CA|nr:LysR family transcriptional regulator [Endozoicomonas arenosclerae]